MKKVVLSVAIMSFALLANAQVLKKDLLKDYKPGDQLEKAVYGDKKEPIRTDSWNGAFSTNPLEGVGSPLVGKALSYKGYPEGGLSIDIGNFPADIKGSRFSVYSLTDVNKEYRKGTYYLAFLANFSKLGGSNFADFVAWSWVLPKNAEGRCLLHAKVRIRLSLESLYAICVQREQKLMIMTKPTF